MASAVASAEAQACKRAQDREIAVGLGPALKGVARRVEPLFQRPVSSSRPTLLKSVAPSISCVVASGLNAASVDSEVSQATTTSRLSVQSGALTCRRNARAHDLVRERTP